jgi:Ca2+-binding RTX toxin-like protein
MAVVQGDNGPNNLPGTAGADQIDGLGGDDTMTGLGGNDTVSGDNGIDTAVLSGTRASYQFTFEANGSTWNSDPFITTHTTLKSFDGVASRDGNDTFNDIEYIQFADGTVRWHDVPVSYQAVGGEQEYVGVFGGTMNDTMVGHAGSNGFIGGLGNDYIDGGAGFDTAEYYAYNSYVTMLPVAGGVQVNLALGTATGAWGNDTLVGIEGAAGSLYSDVLIGNDQANYFDALPGNDTLTGGLGDDTIDGGSGLDWALYQGNLHDYEIGNDLGGERQVNDLALGSGFDFALNIERLQFDDAGIAFDLDGHAGAAARLVGVLFGSDYVHDPAYMRIFIEAFDDGYDAELIASVAIDIVYPTYTDEQIAQLIWFNLAHQQGAPSDIALLTGLIEQYSDAWLAVQAGNTIYNENSIDFAALVANGVEFLPII